MLPETLIVSVAIVILILILTITSHRIFRTMFLHTFRPAHSHQCCTSVEDNEAVIRMITRGRSFRSRHVSRTHRVDLD